MKKQKNNNIILIGMPGCGKSTVGVVLAKIMGYKFMDSDLLIQESEGKLLSEIISEQGTDGFNKIENKVNASICAEKSVIATGGSVIYGTDAMTHLGEIGVIVYIQLPYEEIEHRLGDLAKRGVSIKEGQTLRDLYNERVPLYRQYAHVIVDEKNLDISSTADKIRRAVEEYKNSAKKDGEKDE